MFGFYGALVIHPMLINYPPYQKISYIWVLWGTCQLRTYLAYTSRTLSVWTIVIFTLERFMCIKYPLFSLKLCTIRNSKIIIGSLTAIAMICNINWIFSFKRFDCGGVRVSVCRQKNSMLTFRILDMVMLSAFPAIIIIICNIIIVRTLKSRRRQSLVAFEDSLNKRRDMKITLQLLVVSSTFTILTIPQCISVILNTYHEWHKHTDYRSGDLANFYHISFLLFTINFAINFVLYCFIGDNFRNAAVSLFLCRLGQMEHLRKAIFETQSIETKNSTVTRNQSKKNSIINNSSNRKISKIPKEKDPLVGETLC